MRLHCSTKAPTPFWDLEMSRRGVIGISERSFVSWGNVVGIEG